MNGEFIWQSDLNGRMPRGRAMLMAMSAPPRLRRLLCAWRGMHITQSTFLQSLAFTRHDSITRRMVIAAELRCLSCGAALVWAEWGAPQ